MDAWEAYGCGDDLVSEFDFDSDVDSDFDGIPCSRRVRQQDLKGFTEHSGFITKGGDLLVETLTVKEAMQKAKGLLHCRGFSFRGPLTNSPVEVFFKCKWTIQRSTPGAWTSFRNENPFEPDEVLIIKNWDRFVAGQVWFIVGDGPSFANPHSQHWELGSLVGSDGEYSGSNRFGATTQLPKSEHGDVWVEHDGLPFQVLILKNKYGLKAGSVHWVTGRTSDRRTSASNYLLLEYGLRVPENARESQEVKMVDFPMATKSSLLSSIASAGSTKAWRMAFAAAGSRIASSSANSVSLRGRSVPRGRHDGSQIVCSQCGLMQGSDNFSGNQRKRAAAMRRCKACVASRV